MHADLNDNQLEQIQSKLGAGRKIEAVKLYMDWTGSSLLEAKEYVEQLPADLQSVVADPTNDLGQTEMDEILDAIQQGQKIQAVKIYKESSGASLKESKEFVERLMSELQGEDPSAVTSQSGCGAVILLVVVIGTGVLLHAV